MRIKLISQLVLLTLSPAVVADNTALQWNCPDTVVMESGALTKASIPAGYDAMFSTTPVRLTGINVFDGPPAQGAALVPTSDNVFRSKQTAGKQDSVAKWVFEGDYPQGRFVSCDYAGGLIRLSAKVSDATKLCTASTQYVKPHGKLTASFSCE